MKFKSDIVCINLFYIVIYYNNFMCVIINIFYLLSYGNLVVERFFLKIDWLDFLKIEFSLILKRRKMVEENWVKKRWKDLLIFFGN